MRSYRKLQTLLDAAPGSMLRLAPAMVLVVLALSGCAAMKQDKAAAAPPVAPPKQLASAPIIPLPEPGPQPASMAPTGSLWEPSSGSLYADVRASKIGDVLTITISEQSTGSKAATTTTSKNKQFTGQFTFGGLGINGGTQKGAVNLGPYNGQFSNAFTGNGQTTQADSMTAYMTATVVDVLPNGNMVIRGSRWTKLNDSLQQIILEGVVRPADVTRTNTVLSQNVAEAKIFLVGKGPVAQQQKPGWLGHLLDIVSPF